MPFGRIGQGEFGTYFIGYKPFAANHRADAAKHVSFGRPPGNYDRILDFSRAVTGNLFFVPSATFLDEVTPDAQPRSAICPGVGRPWAIRPPRCPTVLLASARSKEISGMNNLQPRALPRSSDAAWAQIDEEASRTLKRYPRPGAASWICRGRAVSPWLPSAPAIFKLSQRRGDGVLGATTREGESAGRAAGAVRPSTAR